ncbi:MAG: hypothetical protein LBJ25_07505 [Candidatus Margulisbacteria bacterium]|jgi:hypothetical protein|nr:hypothetical protein [Candidatus Margulisiibacteriota bacterium]
MQKKQISGIKSMGISVKPADEVAAPSVLDVFKQTLENYDRPALKEAFSPDVFHRKIKKLERNQRLDVAAHALVLVGGSIGILSSIVAAPTIVPLLGLLLTLFGGVRVGKILWKQIRGLRPESYKELKEELRNNYINGTTDCRGFMKQIRANISSYYFQKETDARTKRQEVWNALSECFSGLDIDTKELLVTDILDDLGG